MTHYSWYQRRVRSMVWTTGLCDSNGDPSAPKIAAFFVLNVALYIAARTLKFDTGSSFVVSIAIAALFGRSVFLHALERGTFGMTRADALEAKLNATVTADATEITKAVLARRADGIEASGKVQQVHND